jgi:hypothetical protein
MCSVRGAGLHCSLLTGFVAASLIMRQASGCVRERNLATCPSNLRFPSSWKLANELAHSMLTALGTTVMPVGTLKIKPAFLRGEQTAHEENRGDHQTVQA